MSARRAADEHVFEHLLSDARQPAVADEIGPNSPSPTRPNAQKDGVREYRTGLSLYQISLWFIGATKNGNWKMRS